MIKFDNKKFIQDYIRKYSLTIQKALIRELEIIVAKLENHAKSSAEYEDQTSNLKSSIGGVVLQDGKTVTYVGFKGKAEGVDDGTSFINSLIGDYKSGFTIIIVAGMEYATYVENHHDLNVLKKTELKMQSEMQKMLSKLQNKLNKR